LGIYLELSKYNPVKQLDFQRNKIWEKLDFGRGIKLATNLEYRMSQKEFTDGKPTNNSNDQSRSLIQPYYNDQYKSGQGHKPTPKKKQYSKVSHAIFPIDAAV
jgi:hypothetical protein